jgi:hypothetical protein
LIRAENRLPAQIMVSMSAMASEQAAEQDVCAL